MDKTYAPPTFSAIVEASFGAVGIRTEHGLVRELVYLPASFHEQAPTDKIAERAAMQIDRYLSDAEFRFDLPLTEVGTAFQQKVWKAISEIPPGQVLTYGDIARRIRPRRAQWVRPAAPIGFHWWCPVIASRQLAVWAVSPIAMTPTVSISASNAGCWRTKKCGGDIDGRSSNANCAASRRSTNSAIRCGWKTGWPKTHWKPIGVTYVYSRLGCKQNTEKPLDAAARAI
jgi:hypothetical protein